MDTRSLIDSELGTQANDDSSSYQRTRVGGGVINESASSPSNALPPAHHLSTYSMHHQDASHENSAIDLFDNLKITEDGDIELSNIYYFGNKSSSKNGADSSDKKKKNNNNGNGDDDYLDNQNDDSSTLYSHHTNNGVAQLARAKLTSTARRVPLTEVSKVQISKFSNYQEALMGFLTIICSILIPIIGGYFSEKCSNSSENTFPCNIFRTSGSNSNQPVSTAAPTSTILSSNNINSNSHQNPDALPTDVPTRFLHYYALWIFVAVVPLLLNSRRLITLFKVVWNFLLPNCIAFYNVKIDFQGTATRSLIMSYNNYDSKHVNPVKLCDHICKSRMNLFGLSNLLTFSLVKQQSASGIGNNNNNNNQRRMNNTRAPGSGPSIIGTGAARTGVASRDQGTGIVYSSGPNSSFSHRLPLSNSTLTITSEYIRLEKEPSSILCDGACAASHKNVKMMFLDDVGEISVIKVPLAKGSTADFANFCMFLSGGICTMGGIGVAARWFHLSIEGQNGQEVEHNKNGLIVVFMLAVSAFIFLVGTCLHLFATRYAVLVNSKSNAGSNTYNPLKSMMSSLASAFVVECAFGTGDNDEIEELQQADTIISVIRTAQRERKKMLMMNYDERREVYGQYCASGTASVLDESEIASRNMEV